MVATVTATNSEIPTSTTSFAARYSQNRIGVRDDRAQSAFLLFEEHDGADEKEPDDRDITHKDIRLGGAAQAVRHRQQHRQPHQSG